MRTPMRGWWLAVLASSAMAQTWEIELLEHPKRFTHLTDRSLRLDVQGRPHVAYGEDWLYYGWHDGAQWRYEVADSTEGVGEYASLALDASRHPHISYYDAANGDLRYAYRDAAGWHREMVDVQSDVGVTTSIALDGAGHPHISYHDVSSGDLRYAYRDAAGWQVEVADAGGWVGKYSSIQLDEQGYPRISYFDGANFDLKYAHRDASGWHPQTVDSQGSVGGYTSLALDEAGRAHISYFDGDPDYDLKYTHQDNAGWHLETVDSQLEVGLWTSLALDASGRPHISYKDDSQDNVKYSYWDGSGWHVETVEQEGSVGRESSIALDEAGFAHISYLDDTDRCVTHAYRDATGWHHEVVDRESTYWPFDRGLALDSSGYPHIGYVVARGEGNGNRELRYAHRDQTGWHTETVPTNEENEPIQHTIALDPAGYPHISYIETTPGGGWGPDLLYAYKDETGWHFETADHGGAWAGPSMAIDGLGHSHVSYSDPYARLKVAHRDEAGWRLEIPIPGETPFFYYPSLDVDEAGYLHIGFVVTAPHYMQAYAWQDADGWHAEYNLGTLWGGGDEIAAPSLAVDAYGTPHILVAGFYLRRDAAGWEWEDLGESVGGAGGSIALDPSGWPCLTGSDGSSLRYACRSPSGWQVETVPALSGGYRSLATDASGNPHISYSAPGGLLYVRRLPAAAEHPARPLTPLCSIRVAPNPLSSSAELMWDLRRAGQVNAAVFDLLGRRVSHVADGQAAAGSQQVTWRPVGLPSGTYVLKVVVDGSTEAVQRLVVRR